MSLEISPKPFCRDLNEVKILAAAAEQGGRISEGETRVRMTDQSKRLRESPQELLMGFDDAQVMDQKRRRIEEVSSCSTSSSCSSTPSTIPSTPIDSHQEREKEKDQTTNVTADTNGSATMTIAHRLRKANLSPLRNRVRVLSPLDVASAQVIRQHLRDVRREVFSRPLLLLVSRLMFHRYNHGLFNERVDPVAWNIPHYFDVVKHPMDLSLVKNKCLNLEYATAEECAADIKLVFANACLFNPPGHVVHEAAKMLSKEFESEYTRFVAKCDTQAKKRKDHSCPHCLANVCGVCLEKCINFEPPLVMCAGACKQRIRRHSVYYRTPDRSQNWCTKCYSSLPKTFNLKTLTAVQVHESGAPGNIGKQALVKAKFLDELTEPWVQCDSCEGWFHQICVLFNAHENAEETEEVPYMCPLCRLKELEAHENSFSSDDMALSESCVDEFSSCRLDCADQGSHSPIPKKKYAPKDYTRVLGFDSSPMEDSDDPSCCSTMEQDSADELEMEHRMCMSSSLLKATPLSRFMQRWVRRHLLHLGESEAARTITIKVVSSVQSSCKVSAVVRENFFTEEQQFPKTIEYNSKAIFVFQNVNGLEVCIFSMYVQEYDKNSKLPSNQNRTYIAYLDSLVYMRPRRIRTSLFHEVLIAYFAFCKRRDFHYAHIWACPTTRGGDFIYWCHPTFQKNPSKDRLLQWYSQMAKKGHDEQVVFACNDLYSAEFENLEASMKQNRLPPYFDGDYWSAEAERLASSPPKRGKLSKEAYEKSLRGDGFRKRVVESVCANRDSLFVMALQPQCAKCGQMIVNRAYWIVRKDSNEQRESVYVCDTCRPEWNDEDKLEKVLPPEYTTDKWFYDGEEDLRTEVSSPFLNHRPDMLKNCEEHHYQFDSLRRAKYSTMMLLYQMQPKHRN